MAVMAASQAPQLGSPVLSLKSKRSSGSSSPRTPLTLDLSDLPPLIQPSPATNTLLITNLDNRAIFHPENLQTLRDTVDQHVAIHTWSPLKSFRRIIVSFYDIPSATFIKQTLDGEIIMDCRVRVYYGAPTELSPTNVHLEAPKVDKLFFISPPPSPPHDWAIRNEEPPNKDVHADDLADALSRLHARAHNAPDAALHSPDDQAPRSGSASGRSRSTTMVYHPGQHGSNPSLPAISVEDTSVPFEEEPEDESSPMEGVTKEPILHTSRPPVELME